MTGKRKAGSRAKQEPSDEPASGGSAAPEQAPEPQAPELSAPTAAPAPAEPTTLEAALRASMPELVIADGELELAGGPTIDLACVDPAGRGMFVRAVEGDSDAAVLEALDLVRGIRENQDVLYRHLGVPRLRDDLPPLAVLVAERFSDDVLGRLTCVEPGALWCLERRSIRSRATSSEHLVPVLAEELVAPERSTDPTEFCRHLSPEHRELGLDLVGRVARIDEELEHAGLDHGVRWSLAGEPVCSLHARDGRLEGAVAPSTVPSDIDSSDRIESFVEAALSRTVELIGAPLGESAEARTTREAALDPTQPILTPEEIQAFRDL